MPATSMNPFFAGALQFAFEKATLEGRVTVIALAVVSLVSWSVILSKTLQLFHAARMTRRFLVAFREAPHLLDLHARQTNFEGAPIFEVYRAGCRELEALLAAAAVPGRNARRLGPAALENVRVALEEAAMDEALALERGMSVLSTAVAGGPFLGLLGTVWGVMETFAGIARVNAANLTAMAPGVAGALVATVIGLLVAIPAMFAYNFMVTRIRAYTQQLDGFVLRFAARVEHRHGEEPPLAEEVTTEVTRTLRERDGKTLGQTPKAPEAP